jgi:anti-sigma B factor antagonist
MNIDTLNTGSVTIFSIQGSVDSLNADQLSFAFNQAILEGHVQLVADFSDVTYTSSAGLRTLLGAVKDSRRLGGDLRIAAVQPNVSKVLSLSGFASIIKMYSDSAAAAASFVSVD